MEPIDLLPEEYRANPFIAALPPPLSAAEAVDRLTALPDHDDLQRLLPATVRRAYVSRLSRYMYPLRQQIDLEQSMSVLIREGYVGRNPRTKAYIQHVLNGAERWERRDISAALFQRESTAAGYALIGVSGMGKSRSVERILSMYPQTIEHSDPAVVQVTWLKLDCPHQGSPKQLCLSFFEAMDRALGGRTAFSQRYGSGRLALDQMILRVAEIGARHSLGLLVVDEIQHLRQARGNSRDDLLNFFVTLMNTICLPVMIIGTPIATGLLQGAFRQARRVSGLGGAWEPTTRSREWKDFIDVMWRFQWTRTETSLTPEIRETLNDVSQGIIDIVLRMYKRSQMRAIQRGEVQGGPETIDPALIRWVAKEDFQLIQPMLDARRRNDLAALREFDDLGPARLSRNARNLAVEDATHGTIAEDAQSIGSSVRPSSLGSTNPAPKKTRTRQKTVRPAMTEDDLRSIAPDAGSAYEALSEAGITKSPLQD
jgi:hypothetical protein